MTERDLNISLRKKETNEILNIYPLTKSENVYLSDEDTLKTYLKNQDSLNSIFVNDSKKLQKIEDNAQRNQNAISIIKHNDQIYESDKENGSVELVSGDNVSIEIVGSKIKFSVNDRTIQKASANTDGLMSKEDYTKLVNIEDGANNYVHPDSGVKEGNYLRVTVDKKGHVISGNNNTLTIEEGGTGVTSVEALKEKLEVQHITIDSEVTQKSLNPVSSAGIYNALEKKADVNHGNHVPDSSSEPSDFSFLKEGNVWESLPDSTLSGKGIVQLSNKTDGESETVAATEKAVNDVRNSLKNNLDSSIEEVKTALDSKVDNTTISNYATNEALSNHISDKNIHITAAEREKWNTKSDVKLDTVLSNTSTNAISNKAVKDALDNKVDNGALDNHLNNTISHITAAEREKWNNILSEAKSYTDEKYRSIEKVDFYILESNVVHTDIKEPSANLIYLEKAESSVGYESWIYRNNAWINIGSDDINLDNYYNKTEIEKLISDNKITVDNTLSNTSTNAISNKAVKDALDNKVDTSTLSSYATSKALSDHATNTTSHITAAEREKWNNAAAGTVTIDTTLDSKSNNPISNSAVSTKFQTIDSVLQSMNSSISSKVTGVSGKGLSTNDLTNTLKSNYDTAYTHSTSSHAPSNAERNIIVGIQKNGNDLTVNSTTRKINISVPTAVSELDNDEGYITSSSIPSSLPANGGTAENSNHVYSTDSGGTKRSMSMNWVGKDGQPTWLWGGENGADMYVYNPSNFSVNYASNAGTVNGHTVNTDVPSDAKFTDTNTTYPISYKTIDASFSTAYRTQTKGNTSNGDYISTIRTETANVSKCPQHGTGLAWGRGDTHGYLYMNYGSAEAYIGAGNANKLNWISKISLDGHTHSQYLTAHQDISGKVNKSGDTLTGRLTRAGGGRWIDDRSNVAIFGTNSGSDSYNCVVGQKTPKGAWTMGNLGSNESLVFNYTTDSEFNSGTNDSTRVTLPNQAGTIITSATIGNQSVATASKVNGHTVESDVPSNAKFTDTTYTLAGLMGGSAKGSATQPVYWNGSSWANTTYTLGKSVPGDAVFTDTNTTYDDASASAHGLMTATQFKNLRDLISTSVSAMGTSLPASYGRVLKLNSPINGSGNDAYGIGMDTSGRLYTYFGNNGSTTASWKTLLLKSEMSLSDITISALSLGSMTLAANYDGDAPQVSVPGTSASQPLCIIPRSSGSADVCWIDCYMNNGLTKVRLKNTVSNNKTFTPSVYVISKKLLS